MVKLYEILINEFLSPTEVEKLIRNAIDRKQIIAIYYQGDKETGPGWRKGIIPLVLATYQGKKYIRAWQTDGKTLSGVPDWKLFRLDRIKNWNLVSQKTISVPPDSRWNPNGDDWNKHIGKGFDAILKIAKF